jgi:hypothetical protein
LVLCTLLTRFVHHSRRFVGPHAPWGPSFTRVSNYVRARRCTIVHKGRHRGSTGQRRVPALHMGGQRTAKRTARQRRGPRALVHRGRPRGWAHVTCGGGRRRPPKTRPSAPPASRRPRPPGLRLALVHPYFGECFRLLPQATSAQPSGLPRCTSARGPRRCRGARIVVHCARVCSAGTRRCLVCLASFHCAHLCSDGRARSLIRA